MMSSVTEMLLTLATHPFDVALCIAVVFYATSAVLAASPLKPHDEVPENRMRKAA